MAGHKHKDHFWALAATGAAAIGALMLGLFIFAQQSDQGARAREETVIENGIGARVREIENQVVPNTVWDDAVIHLDNHFDRTWTHDNIGQYYSGIGHFGFALVLMPNGQIPYAMRDAHDVAATATSAEADASTGLVRRVRRSERLPRATIGVDAPVQASTIAWVNDRLYVVTATLVQPDFGHARIRHAQAPIVVVGRELDQAFIDAFAARYLLTGVHVHDGDASDDPVDAHATLRDAQGVPVATLDWTPQRPGSRLLNAILPPLTAVFAILLAIALALYARAHRTRTHLIESEGRLAYLAHHDVLTGLPNRIALEEALTKAVVNAAVSGAPFAVCCVDLDRFKELNDTYGHDVGDEAIRKAAERLADCAGEAVCVRLDGDAFAVLLDGVDPTAAEAFASTIVTRLSEPFSLSVGPRLIGASVGVALSNEALFEPLEMLRRADMALFRAKADGRGCVRVFDERMDQEFKTRRTLKEDLRADIAAGKLRMVYQPQVRLSGEVVGVEALVRWDHATLGAVSPSVFVPLAEESGLIHALGDFTLRQAARDGLRWPGIKTAVNVSATQLQSPGFVERVKAIVIEAGATPGAIELELTEGVLYANEAQMRGALGALHDAGFSIALDDFGTGYSSLSYLPRFPIDKVKIDRSFVSDLGRDEKSDILFGSIVKLAQTLGMRVIAEGVETHEQWLRLIAAGCPKVQGYVASHPLSAELVAQFVAEKHVFAAQKPADNVRALAG